MNFLKLIRFDILSIILFILVVIVSTIKNQRKVWRRGSCLLFSTAIVAVLCYFDFSNIVTKFLALCNAGFNAVAGWFESTLPAGLATYLLELVIIICILLIDLLLNQLIKLLGGSEKKKFAKYPSYAVQYRPFVSFLGGLVNGICVFALFYFFWTSIGNVVTIDNSADFIFNFINGFENVVDKIVELITHVVAGA